MDVSKGTSWSEPNGLTGEPCKQNLKNLILVSLCSTPEGFAFEPQAPSRGVDLGTDRDMVARGWERCRAAVPRGSRTPWDVPMFRGSSRGLLNRPWGSVRTPRIRVARKPLLPHNTRAAVTPPAHPPRRCRASKAQPSGVEQSETRIKFFKFRFARLAS